jgi:glycosyltransferase involved in cell wall biosynthesis
MRIAVWHNLPSGGGKRSLYDQVAALISSGHTVEVWCPPTANRDFLPLRDLVPEHVVSMDWPAAPRAGRLGAYSLMSSRLRAMDRHCAACAEQIARGGFDVLLGHACQFFRTVPIARKVSLPSAIYLGEPYRWLYEALPEPVWMAPPPIRSTGRANYRSYTGRLFDMIDVSAKRVQVREEVYNARAFSQILVNSFFSRESVLRAYGIDSAVCYLGVDTRVFVDQGLPREPFVIGIGAVVPEKNVHLVIKALRHVPGRPRLVWIGNVAIPMYLESLRQLAARCGVDFEPRINIDQTEVVSLLNRATLMIYAPRLEPFGYAPLEANACGLPVVAVAEGGVRETVINDLNGVIVEADPDQLGAAVQRLLDDPATARRLGCQGRRIVGERWSLAAARERLDSRLRTLVAAAAPSAPRSHG